MIGIEYDCVLPLPVGAIPITFIGFVYWKEVSSDGHNLSCIGVAFTDVSFDLLFFRAFLFILDVNFSRVPLTICKPISLTDGIISSFVGICFCIFSTNSVVQIGGEVIVLSSVSISTDRSSKLLQAMLASQLLNFHY